MINPTLMQNLGNHDYGVGNKYEENIYIMTISLHQGGVVMSSQVIHTQSSNIHPLAHILDTYAPIFSSCALSTVNCLVINC